MVTTTQIQKTHRRGFVVEVRSLRNQKNAKVCPPIISGDLENSLENLLNQCVAVTSAKASFSEKVSMGKSKTYLGHAEAAFQVPSPKMADRLSDAVLRGLSRDLYGRGLEMVSGCVMLTRRV